MDIYELNALGQVLDTSFGRASTSTIASHSIKMQVVNNNTIKLVYSTIINLTTENDARMMKQRYTDESEDIIAKHVKKVKAEYKELTEKALKIKERGSDVSLEIMNTNPYNKKKTALLRRTVVYDLS